MALGSQSARSNSTGPGSDSTLIVETTLHGSDPDGHADDADSELEELEAPESPSSTRKRRTRRRRRHGKHKGPTASTASTASGGNTPSEDDDVNAARLAGNRGVVTWGDLGLGLGLGGGDSSSPVPKQQSSKPAMAKCEISGQDVPASPPRVRDASERRVLPSPLGSPLGQQGHWFYGDTSVSMPPASPACRWNTWNSGDHLAMQGQPASPWGMPPQTPLGAASMTGYGSFPCSPTHAAPAPSPVPTPSGAGASVPSWLRGEDMPLGGEDLAERLRAVAPEAYED